ncbi:class II fructose-bisphosphate aldolase [Paeniglutamicibacter cryotolerans]|uniref:Tagatose 1,6-diphosphate aldolase GatY/KbaY n=1 Tax=Paeniglutamicibacter cryotolerans TaxID=670079 RepID=A0A839QDC7_9MICC|nr:class II fructose-bisphosphate aldolase [Paeniglutamicibacter cryotolerans]MBB2994178.1 tagatose 1,6-diphosphate aldolase GatY/KbaY [Paeniglutamicibacter cryotolerans]
MARIIDLAAVLRDRLADGAAVPALTCYDFTTAQAVVGAAEAAGSPVVLLVAPASAAGVPGLRFITALRTLADAATVPVIVQLDHARDRELIRAAVSAGASAVLADGSHLPEARNAAFVAAVVADVGHLVAVEAELGALPGDEDDATAAESSAPAGMTDPARVARFLAASGADLLAVSIGNVHGFYTGDPQLDWKLLAALRTAAGDVPLVLHGASGIPETDLARAGTVGIGKVNINTELRTRTLADLADALPAIREAGQNMLKLQGIWTGSVTLTTTWALKLLSGG